ncbi:hypothetical protein LWI28_025621 [Acer negundo]|uniref:AMP-binding enzyme C-terminal domain-containing protein n=1 Tax=Acer negundo TaxID=4023 RepID=A0AAD5NKN0_ACENE|nr:hypothetical protein LWI28_025621 [Acer negundo]
MRAISREETLVLLPMTELETRLEAVDKNKANYMPLWRYPDEDVGQIPMAFVVRKIGSNITEAQVMEFTAKQIAPYKQIRHVDFINSIPRSQPGKLLRRELVNLALSATFSTSS